MEIEKDHKVKKYLPIIGALLVITAVVTVCILKMMGSTTTSGGFPDPEKTKSLTCTSKDFVYKFFDYDGSKKKEAIFRATFANNKLHAISFIYDLYYNTKEEIIHSEAYNHAAMNISFSKTGLGPDSFGAVYKQLVSDPENMLLSTTMTTYSANLGDNGSKYFLLDELDGDYTLEKVRQTYRNEGFTCEVKE